MKTLSHRGEESAGNGRERGGEGREERRGWLAGSIVGDFIYETHCYAKRGGTIGERDPPILLIPPRNPCRGCILESRKEIIPHFLRALLRDISRFRMPSLRFPMISSRALFQSRCDKRGITMMHRRQISVPRNLFIYPVNVNLFYSPSI